MRTNLDKALGYLKAGLAVAPLYPAPNGICACATNCGKAGEHMMSPPTNLKRLVQSYWHRHPAAEIGLELKPDMVCLFMPVPSEQERVLENLGKTLPRTKTFDRPEGRYRLYWARQAKGKDCPHTMLRLYRQGQVVRLPGQAGAWTDTGKIEVAPDWLQKWSSFPKAKEREWLEQWLGPAEASEVMPQPPPPTKAMHSANGGGAGELIRMMVSDMMKQCRGISRQAAMANALGLVSAIFGRNLRCLSTRAPLLVATMGNFDMVSLQSYGQALLRACGGEKRIGRDFRRGPQIADDLSRSPVSVYWDPECHRFLTRNNLEMSRRLLSLYDGNDQSFTARRGALGDTKVQCPLLVVIGKMDRFRPEMNLEQAARWLVIEHDERAVRPPGPQALSPMPDADVILAIKKRVVALQKRLGDTVVASCDTRPATLDLFPPIVKGGMKKFDRRIKEHMKGSRFPHHWQQAKPLAVKLAMLRMMSDKPTNWSARLHAPAFNWACDLVFHSIRLLEDRAIAQANARPTKAAAASTTQV